ncbi:hypothetical protein [Propionicicella superfundia]|uniref:hypothetical protein n=1 Tax=Propionicicella superfundia TaxID=348582 RepID=UPI000421AC96|nr:hypothetical protein [Propionicicella superfundia]
MTGSGGPTPSSGASTGWFQTGVGMAALGLIVIATNLYYWILLLGRGDSRGILWSNAALLLAVPTVLAILAIVLLWRRRRRGFWVVVAEFAVLLVTGFGDTTLQTSTFVVQILLVVGIVAAVVGFFRTR